MTSPAAAADLPRIFVVFGMPRTGTTYLYHALAKHPGIHVPYRKESHYFSVNYAKGHAWFASLYEGITPDRIGADINPMYYLDPAAIDRLLAYDPGVKVILGVREPTDFAISLYGNMVAHGLKVPPILDVVQDFDWPLTPETSLRFSLAGGFMQRRIAELQARFGANLMLYDFAAFDRSPLPVLQAMERFLGLPPFFGPDNWENIRINASGRRNLFLLNSLIANQKVLDALYAIVPRAWVTRARRAYERLSVRRGGRETAQSNAGIRSITDDERRALDRLFETDARCYRELFAAGPVIVAGAADPPAAR
jgi:hypothetical protein